MAYNVHRKGRMLVEDEERIQRCTTFIEKEVEATDLTPSLYSANILDLNDKGDINSRETRVARVRRLLEVLMMRGPHAYLEFVKALRKVGYKHVVDKLQADSEDVTSRRSSLATDGKTSDDRVWRTADDRLETMEGLLDQLCLRVSQIESQTNWSDMPDISSREITKIKNELAGLKNFALKRIGDLTRENMDKDIKISELSTNLEEKRKQLEHAEARIKELESRIEELESQCMQYRKNINQLKKESAQQVFKVHIQAKKLQMQSERLDKQEKMMLKQQEQIQEMRQQNEDWMKQMSLQVARAVGKYNTIDIGRVRGNCSNMHKTSRYRKPRW